MSLEDHPDLTITILIITSGTGLIFELCKKENE